VGSAVVANEVLMTVVRDRERRDAVARFYG
ncbi:hypothetical protein A2U01_0057764, partial [Trifolium medium]|nr:hypothetical protein [Trifolium medium]